MANDISKIIPKLLAMGLMSLREMAIMALAVNRGYDTEAGKQGSTIDVPIPSAITAVDVVPAATVPAAVAITPTTVPIALTKWKEAAFELTDKEEMEVMDGVFPMQASSAIRAIVNAIDSDLMALYKDVYGYTGTAGTTPFADITDATKARVILGKQLAPINDRRFVLDPDAEGAAIALAPFRDVSQSSDSDPILNGFIGKKLGFDFMMDQNIPTHTSTVFTAGAATANGVQAVGAGSTDGGLTGTVSIAKATNASPLVKGDIISFAGSAQTYVVLADVSLIVGNTTVSVAPALKKALAGAEAVTLRATHVSNLAFHRDAFALATRPLKPIKPGLGSISASAVDPISKIALRVELTRGWKVERWGFDVLYGCATIRRELATRVAG